MQIDILKQKSEPFVMKYYGGLKQEIYQPGNYGPHRAVSVSQ